VLIFGKHSIYYVGWEVSALESSLQFPFLTFLLLEGHLLGSNEAAEPSNEYTKLLYETAGCLLT
jgi:hypothetical protein